MAFGWSDSTCARIAAYAASPTTARVAASFISETGAQGSGSCPSGPGGSVPFSRCARTEASSASAETAPPPTPRAAAVAASHARAASGEALSIGAGVLAGNGAAAGCATKHFQRIGSGSFSRDASSSPSSNDASASSREASP